MKECKRCFINESFPNVSFDEQGLCSFCQRLIQSSAQIELKKHLELDRIEELKKIAEKIKNDPVQKKAKYDCIVGASGGFDSTYVIYIAKKCLGLNPLVVKYDNGVCHPMANENLKKACQMLDVELRIYDVIENERKYFRTASKALTNLGVFFTACFSCHYIIASIVYREAKKENIKYMLTSTNHVENDLAVASHGFMAKSLIKGFLRCHPVKMFNFIRLEILAWFYFVKLKFQFNGLSLQFIRNLFKLHPVRPSRIVKIDVSEFVAWDWKKIERVLREELGWQTPRNTKVPYFRFDCHYSAMIDKSFKKITGMSEHALLINWFVQAGIIDKEEIQDDFQYMNDDNRINKEIDTVCEIFELPNDIVKDNN